MVTRTKKIFVGGLSAPSTLEDVKNYFEQFGRVSLGIFLIKITSNSVWTKSHIKCLRGPILIFLCQIEDAMLMFDKQTNRHTDRQTYKKKERQTERRRKTEPRTEVKAMKGAENSYSKASVLAITIGIFSFSVESGGKWNGASRERPTNSLSLL